MRIKRILLLAAALWVLPAGAVDKTALLPDTIGAPVLAIALAAPEQYASGHLYEYIDGGADVYIEAGLKSCTVRRYGDRGNKGAEFEVALFTMAAPVNAFGLFRQLHETRTRALGTESSAEPLRVSFWKSSVYAEVIDKSSKPVPDSTLWTLARAVANRLPGDTSLPVELRLLPHAGEMPGTEQYRKTGFLSRSFLDSVIFARYRCAACACTLFVMICASDSIADARLGIIGREFGGDKPRVHAFASRSRVAGCVGCGQKEFESKWFGVLLEQLRRAF
ncbi:MAG TPA: DUF6599 family protein [Chitinivibrionales bacterium]|jgi:hypothetical protein|nr:DUF6599 family protein [Chitinivibrionales bacterium]